MMIPITRKEKYINEIVGGGDTAPETPQTREELFFADILGEVVAPSPVTRVEKYLSAIARQYSGELPEPVTRIERFIARAAGMDVTIPTPITREEMFWADYALIVEKELSGIPPLTFKAKKAGTLKDYRIYGNTAGGESVGDLVAEGEHAGEYKVAVKVEGKNLLNPNLTRFLYAINGASYFTSSERGAVYLIPIKNNTAYTIKVYSSETISVLRLGLYNKSSPISGDYVTNLQEALQTTSPSLTIINTTYKYLVVQISSTYFNDYGFNNLMLNTGPTPLPYEPYHVPITTPIYLPGQIKKVGDEAEYIDYGEQKQHRIGSDDIDVTLPALPTLTGTNVLSVGTAVQPSKVYVKYKGERQ